MKSLPILALIVALAAVAVSVVALTSDDDGEAVDFELTYAETGGAGGSFPLGEVERGEEPSGRIEAGVIGLGQDGEEVGEINTVCVIVTADGDGQCNGTVVLPDGELVLNITDPTQGDLTGSIIGGTGDYRGAYGTFEWTDLEVDPAYMFEFTTP